MRIIVTGASGLLGINLCLMSAQEHELIGIVHRTTLHDVPFPTMKLDLQDSAAVRDLFDHHQPQFLINCAAMADLDTCEKNPEAAWKINATIPRLLAEICAEKKVRMVHVSTDAVFDGLRGSYTEDDQPNPLSIYSQSKLAGEQQVLAAHPQVLVLRVNFYGFSLSGRRSLAEFFLENLLQGKSVKGFTDVHFCPLYVADLVDSIFAMIDKQLFGLYHAVSPECLSKYDFGKRIADLFELDGNLIEPLSVHGSSLLARRSPNLTLRVDKLAKTGIQLPGQSAGLDRFHRHYQHGFPELIKSYTG